MAIETWGWGYDKSLEHAKEIYRQVGDVPCPAFQGELVAVSRVCLDHLVRRGRIPRTRMEQKRRFCLIPYIEQILKNPAALIIFKQEEEQYMVNRQGNKTLVTNTVDTWTFIETIDGCKIKLVVKQRPTGRKILVSIMGDNVIDKPRNKKVHT